MNTMNDTTLEESIQHPSGLGIMKKSKEDLENFSALLDSLVNIDEKLKMLWKQIYENALTDRRNAYIIWTDLYIVVQGNAENHVIHGDHLAKYMERMEKANTQLLKLAELVHKAKDKQDAEDLPTGNDLFDRLERRSR
jgi:hypothetical protein